MNSLVRYSSKDSHSSNFFNDKIDYEKESYDNTKYRNISVLKTLDTIKPSSIYFDNVSGVKEVKSPKPRDGTYRSDAVSILNSIVATSSTKKRTKLDTTVNPLQCRFNQSFYDRMGQGSVSEPNLCTAKDRGDSITLQDICGEDKLFSTKDFGDTKLIPPKDCGVSGCIYVKRGDKIFKSKIEAKMLKGEDSLRCYSSKLKGKNFDILSHSPGNFDSRSKFNDSFLPNTNALQKSDEECDDFEITIFLSGVRNMSGNSSKKESKIIASKKKKSENKFKEDKRGKKKKKKNDSSFIFGKKFEMVRRSFHSPSKLLKTNHYSNKSIASKENRRRKSKIQLNFSSESESDNMPKESTTGKKIQKSALGNTSSTKSTISIKKEKSNRKCNNGTEKKYDIRSKSIVMSESSLCQLSNDYRIPKVKIREGELWDKFETLFRSYASTTRHSGEVIPRKTSTEWMINAGVVSEIMDKNIADDAFRHAAGVKITMNAQEYKEFLIMLTLRMKLPYYEIYRRMCGI